VFTDALEEFRSDWVLAGKAASSVGCYLQLLKDFANHTSDASLDDARSWVSAHPTSSMRRKRAQALRAFGKWSNDIGDNDFPWWDSVKVPLERERSQPTADATDFTDALNRLNTRRDRALLGVLWGCGLRRSEAARLQVTDLNLHEQVLVVRTSKTGQPRVVPIPPTTCRLLRQHLRQHSGPAPFDLSPNGISLMLRRHGILPAHAWRRGWAVESLRRGVSETSVRAAAGWSSGAMVARYTRARSSELAVAEFSRAWHT